ncbi:MAG: CCA tRNA nucleotidyltransferase [Treponema sp.]|jgi:putative nucleotidyltransferase with HDIG domain|nr:CCA tRNA nucleotidyltransferase [Treponema sp.]
MGNERIPPETGKDPKTGRVSKTGLPSKLSGCSWAKVQENTRLNELSVLFRNQGKKLYLVGGAVRDLFRGKEPHDWDLATDAKPDEVFALFRDLKPRAIVIPTGIKHGTVTVHYRGAVFEVTTFRTESDYRDGRHPESVIFASSIEEDLSRRDFTMNSIALELPGGKAVDPFGGIKDIKRKIIRCVGKPRERFEEDGLRPLRALRFAAQLDFAVEEFTLRGIRPSLGVTAEVSKERIRDELDKIIGSSRPSAAFRLMEQTGLLELVLPELFACRGIEQKGYHRFDVLDHSLLACDYAAQQGFPPAVRMAALFHDIGKPETRQADKQGVWTFYQHEKHSVDLTGELMTRLRYPNSKTAEVCRLIACHMFHYDEVWSDGAVRRFIIRVGEENLENLYRLRRSDSYGITGVEGPGEELAALISRVDKVLAGNSALSLKDLAVSGNDLIAAGVKPGKNMGIILGELLETVVDDPDSNTRGTLLDIALKFNARYQS